MGVEESANYTNKSQYNKITISQFDLIYVIGRGGFGKVWKVQYKRTKHQFALKEMSKVKIMDRKSEKSIRGERDFLSQLHNPFIVNMICSFQDKDKLYLVMDLLTGGDLRYHICHRKRFSEEQTTCVLIGLEYIHSNNVIHRDIKPENLVCDENGYLALTDFGVAKKNAKDNSSETSGTPGYMAPEVLCGLNHSFPVDYFALGVMGYEFMLGIRPYIGKNRKEIKEVVLSRQAQIKKRDIPEGWSFEAVDFINELLQRKPSHRLGYNGIEEVKAHPWFQNFKWDDLLQKKTISPFKPKYGDNFDKRYCEGKEQIGTETEERYEEYRNKEKYPFLFNNYTFCRFDNEYVEKYTSNTTYSNYNLNSNSNTNTYASNTKIRPFSFSNMINSKNYNRSTTNLQSPQMYQSLHPQTSTRNLQTPQSLAQAKRPTPNKQFISFSRLNQNSNKYLNPNHLFSDENAAFSARNNKKPLPVLHQNSSMKYINFNGGSSSSNIYNMNGIFHKKHISTRSMIPTQKIQNVNNLKYGTITATLNQNPFLKKSASMASIKNYY